MVLFRIDFVKTFEASRTRVPHFQNRTTLDHGTNLVDHFNCAFYFVMLHSC